MKKFLLIGLIVAFALIIVGGAGVVYARVRGIDNNAEVIVNTAQTQNGDEIIRPFGYAPGGMMGGNNNGYGPGGMMGGSGYGYGPGGMMGERGIGPGAMLGGRYQGIMRGYMVSAFAESVGLTVDQVNTSLANGETFSQIAIAQGKTEADLPALATQVRQAALDKAVADGVITQTQADLMLERMGNYTGRGFGPGFGVGDCPLFDADDLPQP